MPKNGILLFSLGERRRARFAASTSQSAKASFPGRMSANAAVTTVLPVPPFPEITATCSIIKLQ